MIDVHVINQLNSENLDIESIDLGCSNLSLEDSVTLGSSQLDVGTPYDYAEEEKRIFNESVRISNENQRIANESLRAKAEHDRQSTFITNESIRESKTNNLITSITTEWNELKPTLKGDKGDKGDAFTYQDFTPQQLAELKGAKGDKGDSGKDGTNGKDGKDGYTPIKGVDYFDGTNGKDGAKGNDGYTPIKGVDYFDGAKGDKGDQGIQGIQGIQGEKGEKGDDGNDYVITQNDYMEIALITEELIDNDFSIILGSI